VCYLTCCQIDEKNISDVLTNLLPNTRLIWKSYCDICDIFDICDIYEMVCNGSHQSRGHLFIRFIFDADLDQLSRRPDPQVGVEVLHRDEPAWHEILRPLLRVSRSRRGLRGPREVDEAVRLRGPCHPDQHNLEGGHDAFQRSEDLIDFVLRPYTH